MTLSVSSKVIDSLLRHAVSVHPKECCGILFGEPDAIVSARGADNVHPEPVAHFEIDPRALIEAHRSARGGGPSVAGYYHSHPNGRADPSQADRRHAAGDGLVWAIVADGAVRLWRDDPEGFIPLPYGLCDD